MFQCGERPSNWPSREILQNWASSNIVNQGNEYWFWGLRCEQQLAYVGYYLKCAINKDTQACDKLKEIKTNDTTN